MDAIALGLTDSVKKPDGKNAEGPQGAASRPSRAQANRSAAAARIGQVAQGVSALRPRERAYSMVAGLALVDGIVASCGILAGLTLRSFQRGMGPVLATELVHGSSRAMLWVFGGAGLFVWLMAFFRSYDAENVYRLQFWAKNAVKSAVLWVLICLAAVALFQVSQYAPRLGLLFAVGCTLVFLSFWRLLAFAILIQPRVRRQASARLIFVGWNDKAEHLRQTARNDIAQLFEIVGCVPVGEARLDAKPPGEVSVLGSLAQLPRLVRQCGATGIVLADSKLSSAEIQRLVLFCQRESLDFKMIPAYFPALSTGLQVKVLNGVPLLGVVELPLDKVLNRLAKRLVDIVGASVGLVLAAPVIAFFGLLVFIESPGPVIFWQVRMSRSGRRFNIYKIRSMRPNAEAASGAVWAKRDDPRRLRVGAFMRRWNIDELPQFLNVLTGEMSLVGPRPERPELVERFKGTVRNYNARHEVKSGLTGWAQVNGLRGDTDLGKRIEHDLYYMENWSLFLDAYIMVGTIFKYRNAG